VCAHLRTPDPTSPVRNTNYNYLLTPAWKIESICHTRVDWNFTVRCYRSTVEGELLAPGIY